MNIRQAILEASVWIKAHPKQYDFNSIHVPECGTPGCALGWISHFAGIKEQSKSYYNSALPLLDVNVPSQFYSRMDKLMWVRSWVPFMNQWMFSASACSKALRKYADKYHPSTKQAGTQEPKL